MTIRKTLTAISASLLIGSSLNGAVYDQKISAKGSALIEADVETTQHIALEEAKKNAVISALSRLLGYSVSETDESLSGHIANMTGQFDTYAKILSKSPSRDGATFILTLNVSIDEKAFRSLMKDEGIGLIQKVREAGRIVMLFDENEKPYDQPQEMFNEYLHYAKDQSHLYDEHHKTSSEEMQGTSYLENSDNDENGSLSNNQSKHVQRNAYVSDRISDKQMNKEEMTYSKKCIDIHEISINSGYVKSQLQKMLKTYGLEFVDGSGKLAEFNRLYDKSYISYNDVLDGSDSTLFKEFLNKVTGAEYMALAYSQINYSIKPDDTTGKFGCTTTQSNVTIFSLRDSKLLDSGSLEAVQLSERSIEACKSNARYDMADRLGNTIGLGIQKTIRDAERTFISGPINYTVTVQGSFERPIRRALESLFEGSKTQFKSFKLTNQSKESIQYEIVYSGSKNLGDAILDAVDGSANTDLKDRFEDYDFKPAGQNGIVLYRVK